MNTSTIKKALRFSKKIVIFSIAILIVYSIIAIVYQFISGFELAPTLTSMFFTVFGIELGATSLIKITDTITDIYRLKIQNEEKLESEENQNEENENMY